jgi:hypothetical protein
MPVRTTETTVTFNRPFSLPEFERPQPAGTYRLVTDEEEILGVSFLAFRRIETRLRLPSLATANRPVQMIPIDANDLAAALRADQENR